MTMQEIKQELKSLLESSDTTYLWEPLGTDEHPFFLQIRGKNKEGESILVTVEWGKE